MKLVLFVVAILVLLWLLRGAVGRRGARPAAPTQPEGKPQAMISCAQCGLHLPRDEALPGRGGVFCSDAHRAAFERAHADG